MNSIFEMFMESRILRVSCKVSEAEEGLHMNFVSMNIQKIAFIAYLHFIINI